MIEDGGIFGRKHVVWICLLSECWRSYWDAISRVMLGRKLKEGDEFPALLARKHCRRLCAFNDVFVKVNKNEIVVWKLKILISAFDSNDVRARSFQCLYQARWQDWDEDSGPLQRIE
jgi:hypothetical protein